MASQSRYSSSYPQGSEILYNIEHIFQEEDGRVVRKMPIKVNGATLWVDCVPQVPQVSNGQVRLVGTRGRTIAPVSNDAVRTKSPSRNMSPALRRNLAVIRERERNRAVSVDAATPALGQGTSGPRVTLDSPATSGVGKGTGPLNLSVPDLSPRSSNSTGPIYSEEEMQNRVENALRGLKRKIGDILECNICKDIPRGQIKQCLNGHIACEKCMHNDNLTSCAMCREPLGEKRIRALNLEQLIEAADLDVSCKHLECKLSAPKKEITTHEKKCEHRVVPCPDSGCDQEVPLHRLLDHMKSDENSLLDLAFNNPTNQWYEMGMDQYKAKYNFGWTCRILKFRNKLFASCFRRVNRWWYLYTYIMTRMRPRSLKSKFQLVMQVKQ